MISPQEKLTAIESAAPFPRCSGLSSSTSRRALPKPYPRLQRSEEHTSELQSQSNIVCRLLLEKKIQNLASFHEPPPHIVATTQPIDPPNALDLRVCYAQSTPKSSIRARSDEEVAVTHYLCNAV